jgi:hypothetical protein
MARINPKTVVCDSGPHAHDTSPAPGENDVFDYFNRIHGIFVSSANNSIIIKRIISININTIST